MRKYNGFSLIELLIAIGIIAILTGTTIASIRFNNRQKVRQLTESVASDIRLVRNMVTSRVAHQRWQNYPPGGYGMYVQASPYSVQGYYVIYADNGVAGYQPGNDADDDAIIKTVEIQDKGFRIMDRNAPTNLSWDFYFSFVDEHTSSDDMQFHPQSKYLIMVADAGPNHLYKKGYAGIIVLGELDTLGYTWSNLATSYVSYTAVKYNCSPLDPDYPNCPQWEEPPDFD